MEYDKQAVRVVMGQVKKKKPPDRLQAIIEQTGSTNLKNTVRLDFNKSEAPSEEINQLKRTPKSPKLQ